MSYRVTAATSNFVAAIGRTSEVYYSALLHHPGDLLITAVASNVAVGCECRRVFLPVGDATGTVITLTLSLSEMS